jgi:sigma-B regulation protein RsbU (phosphoserine phosphatase)
MPQITFQASDGTKKRLAIAKERLSIGRSRESDVFLPDQFLSRHHAEIRASSGGHYIVDLGSKNGTLLNGAKIDAEMLLREGDVITIGDHALIFSAADADGAEDELEPVGTRVFSAKELSSETTKPTIDPQELQRRNSVLGILTRTTAALVNHRPLPELFELLLNLLFEAVPAERAAILLLEGTPPTPVVRASRSQEGPPITKVSRSIVRKVIEETRAVILPNVLDDAAFRSQDSILSTGIRSAVCVPLWYTPREGLPDQVIGLIYLDTLRKTHSFEKDDLHILTALANIAAAKIENVRLLEESLEKRRMEEDMQRAADIQRRLLPEGSPHIEGYDIVGSNRPCLTVGGDYYDFMVHGNNVLMALGDVSGKGTGAALLMAVLRAAVRAHWHEGSMAEALERINSTVCQNVPEGKYVTFFAARLETTSGKVTYVNAGHNAPLLVRAGGAVERLEEGGMVLGMFEGVPYAEGVVELRGGDLLIAFSDGVTETFDEDGEEFGEERLLGALLRCRTLRALDVEKELLRDLDDFAKGAKATDDRTVIVLKRH